MRMWDLVEWVLRAKFDEKGGKEKDWEETRKKVDGFRGAYGTVSVVSSFIQYETLQVCRAIRVGGIARALVYILIHTGLH